MTREVVSVQVGGLSTQLLQRLANLVDVPLRAEEGFGSGSGSCLGLGYGVRVEERVRVRSC